ncbi:MAG: CHAT domain-containing protein [Microcoleus sp.]
MSGVKLVFLKINNGNFDQGFKVNLRIYQAGNSAFLEADGRFPAAPKIPEIYQSWQKKYLRMDWCFRARKGETINDVGKVPEDCSQSSQKLRESIKEWLRKSDDSEFQKIRERLIGELDKKDEIRVFIQTKDELLKKIPWQEWDLFADTYTNSEIVLSPPENTEIPRNLTASRGKFNIKILSILGCSQGIDVQVDQKFLKSLPNTEPLFLPEPRRKQLSDSLWEQNWDILFFAGHSWSDNNSGNLAINSDETLTLLDLKHGLRCAIENGLQLAIFNSCDGLKLAENLADLHIPLVIVMREPVPDRIAQEFLKYFLTAYSSGEPLYLAARKARERLETEGLDKEFPGATWLPIICQNPAVEPPTWQGFLSKTEAKLPWSFRELKKTWKTEHTLTDHSDIIKSVAIHPDGQIFASCSLDQTIKVWNLTTGELLENLTEHSGGVTCVTFSSDGKTLASSSANPDGTIKLWDTPTWQLKRTLKGDDWVVLSVWSIALTPNGKTLVSGHHADSTVKVWNLETGELRHTLRGHVWAVHDVAIAPDGNIMASGSFDSNIKLWNLHTGREIRNLNGPGDGPIGWTRSFFSDNIVYTVSFSPDGQTLASGGAKQPIKLWRLSSGEIKSNLTGHTDDVHAIAFSPDGKYLASGSADRTIRIWDLFTGEPIHTLGHSDTVYCLAFSPDGQTLVSGSRDRTIKIWRFST